VLCVCARVTVGYICDMVHQFFWFFVWWTFDMLGDGIMLCVWYVFCIGCWCIAGLCVVVRVRVVVVCDTVIHVCILEMCVSVVIYVYV